MASPLRRILDSLSHLDDRVTAMQRREDARRADSLAKAREIEERRDYRRQMRNQTEMADLQAVADDALSPWNIRAPAPSATDDRRSYQLRLARLAARQLPPGDELRSIDLGGCDDGVLRHFVPDIFKACKEAVNRADTLAPGQMREVKETTAGKADITRFVGSESFVKAMQPPARRVTQFCRKDGSMRD
jgi:hypothetical protein